MSNTYFFLKKKLYFDLVSYYLMELYFFITYDVLYKLLDKGLFEFIGPRSIILFFVNYHTHIKKIKKDLF